MAEQEPCLLGLPSEIRLQIYHLLLNDKGRTVFEIRHESPELFKLEETPHRTSYRVLGRGLTRQSFPTTYHLVSDAEMHTAIMGANRQIHEETSYLLYGRHTFSFGRDIEAVVPFFSDITRRTRPFIHEIALFKQGSVYDRDYDRCEWSNVCEFLQKHMQLRSLKLVVEGGMPSMGWAGLPEYSVSDFKTLSSVKYEPLEWVWELLSVKGIGKLDVKSEIHHCPPSHSAAMGFFAAFSASIETGFTEFLRSEMLIET
jgi:hypothetical protein